MHEILIVEDNEGLRDILAEALSLPGYSITACGSAEEAFEKIKESDFDVVITDLKLPEADGIAVLEAAKNGNPNTDVIVATAFGSVDRAVDAMRKGAADFITKPFSISQIRMQVAKLLESRGIKKENEYLKAVIREVTVGASGRIKEILAMAEKVAVSDATVLITGESGTGKELIAARIHEKSSRKNNAFIKVNCAALAPGVLESELFGHEKGAFTDAFNSKKGRFEMADNGTLFLDEIGDLPIALQVKLLRVLQEKSFERVGGEKTIKADVRIIAATNRELKSLVREGKFREDLYYRLNVININMPPLRERKEDIPVLIEHFIAKYSGYNRHKTSGIDKPALEIMMSYGYPGNIRELENIIQRMMVMCSGKLIKTDDIPFEIKGASSEKGKKGLSGRVSDFEKRQIIDALNRAKGNKIKAAELLNVKKSTFLEKLKKYGLNKKGTK